MNTGQQAALPAAVTLGFIRIMSNAAAIKPPMPVADAISEVRQWLQAPNITTLDVSSAHWDELEKILTATGWAGPRVSDAHLAALAIAHGAVLHSHDTDFDRVPGLQRISPLALAVPPGV